MNVSLKDVIYKKGHYFLGSTEQGNLVKMRNSNLGQSAPSLFVNSQVKKSLINQ